MTGESELTETPPPGYGPADVARFVTEPAKRPARAAFARDRARVLHSAGLRRLAAKTQVMVAGESDFPRTRLTHTLEVAQIARELGGELGADPDVTDLAGLAHDLGHPPFGHNGEDALDQAAASIGGFEGNAQSFRLLTRLESKITAADGRSVGLNLTRAALDSTVKYPWTRQHGERKFNCYADDREIFDWVRAGAEPGRRCFEAQVMDWSDDVAYSVHDVEDGIQAGHIHVEAVRSRSDRATIATLAQQWYAGWADTDELDAALERIAASPIWPSAFDGSPASLATLKHFTSQITGRFVNTAVADTRAAFGDQPLLRYRADVVVSRAVRCEVAALKGLANLYVFQRANADAAYVEQRRVVLDVVAALATADSPALDPVFTPAWLAAESDDARLRVIIDQVASLTDASLLRWHRRLCG